MYLICRYYILTRGLINCSYVISITQRESCCQLHIIPCGDWSAYFLRNQSASSHARGCYDVTSHGPVSFRYRKGSVTSSAREPTSFRPPSYEVNMTPSLKEPLSCCACGGRQWRPRCVGGDCLARLAAAAVTQWNNNSPRIFLSKYLVQSL